MSVIQPIPGANTEVCVVSWHTSSTTSNEQGLERLTEKTKDGWWVEHLTGTNGWFVAILRRVKRI